jgi:hypothetical protein
MKMPIKKTPRKRHLLILLLHLMMSYAIQFMAYCWDVSLTMCIVSVLIQKRPVRAVAEAAFVDPYFKIIKC